MCSSKYGAGVVKRFGVGVDTEDADFLADADSSSDTGKTIKDTNVVLFVSAWPNQSTAVHVALGSKSDLQQK